MSLNPSVRIMSNGVQLPCSVSEIDTRALVLDEVSISWGRAGYFDMPQPATATIRLVDKVGEWAAKAAINQGIGTTLDVQAFGPDEPRHIVYTTEGANKVWYTFRGRIAALTVTPTGWDKKANKPLYWIVTITAADRTADLGNIVMPEGTVWPAETAIQRAVRIRDLAAPAGIVAFYFDPSKVNWPMYALDVSGQSLLELTGAFYRSVADTWAYDPSDNTVRNQWRLHLTGPSISTVYFQDMVDPVNDPVTIYAGSTTKTGKDGNGDPSTITYAGFNLDGCKVTANNGVMDLAPNAQVNRFECSWKNFGGGGTGNDVTTVVDRVAPGEATRALTFTSWLSDGLYVDPTLSDIADRARVEGSIPRHPAVTFDTRPFGGFDAPAQEWLTVAAERPAIAFLSGSPYTPITFAKQPSLIPYLDNAAPMFSIIGGTITYRKGWIINSVLQPWEARDPNMGTVSWSDVDSQLQWGVQNGHGIAASTSWVDTSFLTRGDIV